MQKKIKTINFQYKFPKKFKNNPKHELEKKNNFRKNFKKIMTKRF